LDIGIVGPMSFVEMLLGDNKDNQINNNQSILEGLIRAMPQLTERNQLM